jgi:protein CpxP
MPRFFHRILFAVLTSVLLLPLSGQTQEQDKSQSQNQTQHQPQAGSQTDGQERHRRGMRHQRQRMARLAKKLNLSEAQKQQFQQIGKDMRKQGMAIRQDSSLTGDQKKEKMQALRKQAHQQMFGVLTPEQKEQLKQMREQHRKEQGKEKDKGDQASAKQTPGSGITGDDDPFAGMISDEEEGGGNS